MMKGLEKINIDIKIGGEPIKLQIPFENQDFVREVEAEVNSLYVSCREDFPSRTDKSLMAMMVYKYASLYKDLTRKYQEAVKSAEHCLSLLAENAEDAES